MTKRGKKPLIKEEIAEDWCFVCKEGGDLLICDYRQCLKAYHVHCVGKDESFLTSEERWNCKWHYCFICERAASFRCHCCPKAVCRYCSNTTEFVVVRGNYGFCCDCLKLALLIEENRDVDSDGETVDFKDLNTYEGLFLDYYSKMIKENKNLTLEDLRAAKDRLKKGKFDSDDFVDEEDEIESDYEVKDIIEEDFKLKRRKEFKGQLHVKKPKNVKSKKMQFAVWGSTPLIQFLESIGQETSKELHQHNVETLINTYIKENKLFDPEKKRKIMCDEKLQAIFGRKVVNRSKIYSLLEPHFANNLEKSEEEEEEDDDTAEEEETTFDENEDALVVCKTRKKLKEGKDSPKSKPVCGASQSHFAAISAENIKLVYLRRSLLQELSKEPELFQNKVKGSFVRVKTDRNDYFQRNSHQLLQVTGVKKSSSGENNAEMILHGSTVPLEIHMGSLSDADLKRYEEMISDGHLLVACMVQDILYIISFLQLWVTYFALNKETLHVDAKKMLHEVILNLLRERFSEAECVDLRQKVKDGLIQKPTVAELQEKARSLHEDITKNWIARELKLLDIRINQANEKGWKRELYDYMDKRQLLQTPLEQLRLLETYPTVIAEQLEPMIEENVHNRKGNETSPQSVCPTDLNCKWGNSGTSRGKKYPGHALSQDGKQNFSGITFPTSTNQASTGKSNKTMAATLEGSPDQLPASEYQCKVKLQGKDEMCSSSPTYSRQNQGINTEHTTSKRQEPFVDKAVVNLSSDDDSGCSGSLRKQKLEDPNSRVWLIAGPNGERNGKYTLSLLKCWSEASPYALKFKAWKETETEEQAIWLGDAIKLAFNEK